ncbi:MAG TPA: histidinol-phosphatase HisJ family protein [Candidatus Faecousia intestinigallinarum]|nr:histidinol-phosphatase HisJ family protein [Candidatus Faecousia intestinigallinarum]
MFDFHIHSTISFDGHDSPEEMLAAAEAAGLREICFTDHRDYAANTEQQTMLFDWQRYGQAYDCLESPKLKIRRGMEFGLKPDNVHVLEQDAAMRDFDFILGSVHFVEEQDVYFEPYWEGKTIFEAERRFLEETLRCVQVHKDYDVLAHLTFLSKARAHPLPQPIPYYRHREVADEILRTLAQKGKGLEMNTSGVDRCGDFLPGADYFRRFKELGGEIVTIGSDAHTAARVGQHTSKAGELLGAIFGYVCTFAGRQPIFHKL